MTATDPAPPVCPVCRSTETMVGGSGLALCYACTEQWDPAKVVAGPAPALAPFSMASVEDVFGPAQPTDEDVARNPANVMHDPETPLAAMIPEPDAHTFPPTWEGLAAYRTAGGVISDELWYDNFIAPAAEPLHPADAVDPDALAVLAVQAELAALIVKAAVASPADAPELGFTSFPPAGFLPTTKDLQPVIEQAAVQAVRGLIAVYELDPARILAALGVTSDEP